MEVIAKKKKKIEAIQIPVYFSFNTSGVEEDYDGGCWIVVTGNKVEVLTPDEFEEDYGPVIRITNWKGEVRGFCNRCQQNRWNLHDCNLCSVCEYPMEEFKDEVH